jgi:acetylornithine/N-succinyldiaminopimelate aminotransferase
MSSFKNTELQGRWDAAMMPNYGTPPVALARGEGCTVWDVDGREYLDLIGGIAVSALGHAHPALVEAVTRQVGTLAHTSNLFLHEPGVRLAERLLELLGHEGRVYLCNSGTEANEAAFKLVRRHAGPGKTYVVAAEQSFHGRTMGSLALTGKSAIREPFGPYGPDVRFVPYGDVASLESVVTDGCAAVFLEPTQGEGGILPAPEGYLREARRICDATGALLVLDEIQSGIGRTGAWFQHQREGMRPDIITLAKGLGGGLPIGACVAFGDHGSIFAKGEHGSTYGGNLVGCAAALAVLDTIERENLLDHVVKVGDQLADGIVATGHPLIVTVRGSGLWRGIVLAEPVGPAVEAAARDAGFLTNALRPEVIRLAPPLIIDSDEVRTFVDALPGILEAAR